MILDKVQHLDKYKLPQAGFQAASDFIKTFNPENFVKGKFEISGEQCFGIGLAYDTKQSNECLWEAHQKYIDIHFIIEGVERIHINDIAAMKVTKEHDNEGDYALFDGSARDEVVLSKGQFLLLFPNEVHKTSIIENEVSAVTKLVIKVLIND